LRIPALSSFTFCSLADGSGAQIPERPAAHPLKTGLFMDHSLVSGCRKKLRL